MAFCVANKGPLGGIVFYPKEIQNKVIELELTTEKCIKKRKKLLLLVGLITIVIVYFIMIIVVNKSKTYFDIIWQFYVLFIGMEVFDLVAVDIIWVAKSSWWDIPGIEEFHYMYHNPMIKVKAKAKLLVVGVPVALIFGLLYYPVSQIF